MPISHLSRSRKLARVCVLRGNVDTCELDISALLSSVILLIFTFLHSIFSSLPLALSILLAWWWLWCFGCFCWWSKILLQLLCLSVKLVHLLSLLPILLTLLRLTLFLLQFNVTSCKCWVSMLLLLLLPCTTFVISFSLINDVTLPCIDDNALSLSSGRLIDAIVVIVCDDDVGDWFNWMYSAELVVLSSVDLDDSSTGISTCTVPFCCVCLWNWIGGLSGEGENAIKN